MRLWGLTRYYTIKTMTLYEDVINNFKKYLKQNKLDGYILPINIGNFINDYVKVNFTNNAMVNVRQYTTTTAERDAMEKEIKTKETHASFAISVLLVAMVYTLMSMRLRIDIEKKRRAAAPSASQTRLARSDRARVEGADREDGAIKRRKTKRRNKKLKKTYKRRRSTKNRRSK